MVSHSDVNNTMSNICSIFGVGSIKIRNFARKNVLVNVRDVARIQNRWKFCNCRVRQTQYVSKMQSESKLYVT